MTRLYSQDGSRRVEQARVGEKGCTAKVGANANILYETSSRCHRGDISQNG